MWYRKPFPYHNTRAVKGVSLIQNEGFLWDNSQNFILNLEGWIDCLLVGSQNEILPNITLN